MTSEQIVIVGVAASVLTFLLKVLTTYLNYYPGRLVVNIVLYGVAGMLAVLFVKPVLPPFSEDIGAFISALFQIVAPIVGLATLVYNALYTQVVVPVFVKLKKK